MSSIRIRTTPNSGEQKVNIQLNQDFDFIEILSLKITQDEVYKRYSSNYGVVVGRVVVNNGFGVPNAKVSIFIPITNDDKNDPEIYGLYPYEITTDKNKNGYRYNLLPKTNETLDQCFTPVGSMLTKREVQDNAEAEEIYCKYYKYTTVTNNSGDFMLFGVPVGAHYIHVDADVSDIGFLSQNPYDLIRDGADVKSFESTSKYKEESNLDTLSQIKTRSPIGVNVIPFWGDTSEFEIGITRADVNLATIITPQAIFMGSIFGDNDKHAISKRCRPRRKMGNIDQMTTGEGLIEMIRQTPSGRVERYDVEGGAVIDKDGTWAYQVPMNLDFKVTDEYGNLVPTDDPDKGIPTRARVRFRAGMLETGAEGRLRTRAKYLIPHNPDSYEDSDYSFNEQTRDKHFTDLYWNKIYTVANYVTRFQSKCSSGAANRCVGTRRFMAIKEVDDGNNNPFPFNKFDTVRNPLFTVLCIIITIIGILMRFFNRFLIPLLNLVLTFINVILAVICVILSIIGRVICFFSRRCKDALCICSDNFRDCPRCCKEVVPYIPYITLGCSGDDDEGVKYCVGCVNGPRAKGSRRKAWNATINRIDEDVLEEENPDIDNTGIPTTSIPIWPGSSRGVNDWDNTFPKGDAGWVNCIALTLADVLDIFKFDFYNDWINGTLYSYLLKYKVRTPLLKSNRGKEKFCDFECGDDELGADGNMDNQADNRCFTNVILDSCTDSFPQNLATIIDSTLPTQGIANPPLLDDTDTPPDNTYFDSEGGKGNDSYQKYEVSEGLIRKDKESGELYYAAYSKTAPTKLYATKIVSLGSIFDYDWQGVAKIHPYIVDTTYKIPPLATNYWTEGIYSGEIEISGFDSPSRDPNASQIVNVRCFKMTTGDKQCNNIKRICQYGMNYDEDTREEIGPSVGGYKADSFVNNKDVDNPYIRGAFVQANSVGINGIPPVYIDSGFTNNNFDYRDPYYMDFTGIYRNNTINDGKIIWQYDNSFYFYFGLLRGKTALQKMKAKYFPPCVDFVPSEMVIIIDNIINDSGIGTGAIDFHVDGGISPYRYQWIGPTVNGNQYTCDTDLGQTCGQVDGGDSNINGLYGGTYTLTVTDSSGLQANITVNVGGLQSITCDVTAFQSSPVPGGESGKVHIYYNGGNAPYYINIFKDGEPITEEIVTVNTSPYCYGECNETLDLPRGSNQLPPGNYTVTVNDSGVNISGQTISTSCSKNFTISEAEQFIASYSINDVQEESNVILPCNGSTAYGSVDIIAGASPYTVLWQNTNGFTSTGMTPTNLTAGSYTLTIEDVAGQSQQFTFQITEPTAIPAFYKTAGTGFADTESGWLKITGIGAGASAGNTYTVIVDGPSTAQEENILPNEEVNFYQLNSTTIDDTYTVTIQEETSTNQCTRYITGITVDTTPENTQLEIAIERIAQGGGFGNYFYEFVVGVRGGWDNRYNIAMTNTIEIINNIPTEISRPIVSIGNSQWDGKFKDFNNEPRTVNDEPYTKHITFKVLISSKNIPFNFDIWVTDRNQGITSADFTTSTYGAVRIGWAQEGENFYTTWDVIYPYGNYGYRNPNNTPFTDLNNPAGFVSHQPF